MAFKPIDPKRDEFRRYLERAGVVEALTKVFVRIVKERPENPIEYLRHNLGDSLQQADNMAYLQSELEESRVEIQRLRDIIDSINPEALEEGLTQHQQSPPQVNEEVQKESAVEDNHYHESHENGATEIPSDLEAEAPSPLSTNDVSEAASVSPAVAVAATAVEGANSYNNDVQNTAASPDAANFANDVALSQAK